MGRHHGFTRDRAAQRAIGAVRMPDTAANLRSVIADAHASSTPLRIEGAGTWLTAGRPVAATACLSTRHLSGIVEYVPGDLVLTALAGTTLQEIAHATAPHEQWLALDPFTSDAGVDSSTIGATSATASQGPLALGYGRARDLILGLSFVTGDGTAVRAGGRVVKNVAGFDLVRLATGAWGTLGVITQVSVRLHARPTVDETFAIGVELPIDVDARERALSALVTELNGPSLLGVTSSLAALVLLAHDAPTLVQQSHAVPTASMLLLARATGNRHRVNAQRHALATLGRVVHVDGAVWRTVRTLEAGNTVLRITDAPLRTATTFRRVEKWVGEVQGTHVSTIIEPMRGAIRVSCRHALENPSWSLPEHAIAEQLPVHAWGHVSSAVNDNISQRLRQAFDPRHILNPGILGEAALAVASASSA